MIGAVENVGGFQGLPVGKVQLLYPVRLLIVSDIHDQRIDLFTMVVGHNSFIKSVVKRDAIHMNVVTGRYMMHNAMREALGQPRSAKGYEKLDPKLKAYFDGVLDWGEKKSGKVGK